MLSVCQHWQILHPICDVVGRHLYLALPIASFRFVLICYLNKLVHQILSPFQWLVMYTVHGLWKFQTYNSLRLPNSTGAVLPFEYSGPTCASAISLRLTLPFVLGSSYCAYTMRIGTIVTKGETTVSLGWLSHICGNHYSAWVVSQVWLISTVDKNRVEIFSYTTLLGLIRLVMTVHSPM